MLFTADPSLQTSKNLKFHILTFLPQILSLLDGSGMSTAAFRDNCGEPLVGLTQEPSTLPDYTREQSLGSLPGCLWLSPAQHAQ